MNREKVVLTVTRGSLEGKEYVFENPAECVVGRASDCAIALPQSWENMNVSRHHCAFEIDPPAVWIRDLKSHNGTYVNGNNIGVPTAPPPTESGHGPEPAACELNDGDEVKIGNVVFRVEIGDREDKTNPGIVPLYFL
jgi:pSer/pThr/pTyr-binding forkhead associated (FHA) protein